MRYLVVLSGAVASALVLVSVATAKPPTRTSNTTVLSFTESAGTACDFDLHVDANIVDDLTTFSGGRFVLHTKAAFRYTNVATGAALTSTSVLNENGDANGSNDVGVVLKLRDASGKVVGVFAGRVTFDGSFNIVSFTPNADPNGRTPTICSALGGNAA
jgi:hypothetical protein